MRKRKDSANLRPPLVVSDERLIAGCDSPARRVLGSSLSKSNLAIWQRPLKLLESLVRYIGFIKIEVLEVFEPREVL